MTLIDEVIASSEPLLRPAPAPRPTLEDIESARRALQRLSTRATTEQERTVIADYQGMLGHLWHVERMRLASGEGVRASA